MRKTKKRQAKLDEIGELAKKIGVVVIWEDLEIANYATLCFISTKLQLAQPITA